MIRRLLFVVLLPLACLAQSRTGAPTVGGLPGTSPPVFALRNATVVVGNGIVLENATVVLNDGLIEAVGPDVRIPSNAWVMDLKGKYIYPGFIDCLSEAGLKREQRSPEAASGSGSRRDEPAAPDGGMLAHVRALDLLESDSKDFQGWRDSGVLSLNIAPAQGIFMGQAAVINLNGGDPRRMTVKASTAARTSFQSNGWNTYPGSLLGVIATLRQTLLDARQYGEATSLYLNNPRGLKRPDYDRVLEALQPVVQRTMPLIFPGKRERDIRRAVLLAREQSVNCIVAGGFEADRVAHLLRENNVPVLLSLNFPQKEKETNPEAEDSLDELEYRYHAPRAAGLLEEAAVRFGFYSDGLKSPRDFLKNLRVATRNGLSKEIAIRAATLTAAQILGVDEQLGSIENGKIANLLISDGDILDEKSRLTQVFVDGEFFEIPGESEPGGPKPAAAAQKDAPAMESERGDIRFSESLPTGPDEKLIKNATVMTVTQGTLKNTSVLIQKGKIAAIGRDLQAGPGAEIIDAAGRWLTPGIVDCHNHIASDSINESSVAVSSMTRMEDVLDPTDINIYRDLAGGVTTAHVLHGSANPIGGQNIVIKLRWGQPIEQLIFSAGKPGLKFALGENPKRSNFMASGPRRYPSSRMGVEDVIRSSFLEAREYAARWEEYERKKKEGVSPLIPPRRDLKLEPLVEVLKGERLVHVHAYRADEMLTFMRLADDFGFKVTTFDHGLEGYKIAREIAAHGATVTTFSDWWAYKTEAYDSIPYNAALLTNKGVLVSLNSDGAEESRHLFQEAAKCMQYGGLSEDQALALITINPAKQLRIDGRVGSIEVGKDADLVLFGSYPLSSFAVPEMVFIDGELYFSRQRDSERQKQIETVKKQLLEAEKRASGKPEEEKDRKEPKPEPPPTKQRDVRLGSQTHPEEVRVGSRTCEEEVTQ